MWDQYEPPGGTPGEKPGKASPPDPGLTPTTGRFARRGLIVAGGSRSTGAGVALALVAMVASIGVVLAFVGSTDEPEPDYSGFYDCVAQQDGEGGGLLSPGDICEIGNERPPDYVDRDEDDPFGGDFGDDGYGNDSGY